MTPQRLLNHRKVNWRLKGCTMSCSEKDFLTVMSAVPKELFVSVTAYQNLPVSQIW